GRFLATGEAAGTLRLWDVARKRPVASRKGHTSNVECVAFSPDSRRLATGSEDGTVKVWDFALLQEVATLSGHEGPVNSVAFSPDATPGAGGGAAATVRLGRAPPLSAGVREPAKAPSAAPVETTRLFCLELRGTAQATLASEGNVHRVDVTAVDGEAWYAR